MTALISGEPEAVPLRPRAGRRSTRQPVEDDWQWQWHHRIRTASALSAVLRLHDDERAALEGWPAGLPFAVTPYYLDLVDPDRADDPIRRCVVPTVLEAQAAPCEAVDPLSEAEHSPVPGLVHRYPDRVLLLATSRCATYCRYCTRSRLVGRSSHTAARAGLERGIEYIRATPAIRDVLVSGGDPLTLGDEVLDWLLGQLRAIRHVEVIRIGTKVPAVLPQRITGSLLRVLRRHHPLWISIHVTHPAELTPEMTQACERLADAGIPLGSQTVLLQGINDDVDTMRQLMTGLMRRRVRPYYLYQCDPILGSSHFRTPVESGLDIIRGLRGHVSGYAVPTYVIDAPGGGGKIPVMPDYVHGHEGGDLLLTNYSGGVYRYPDHEASGLLEGAP